MRKKLTSLMRWSAALSVIVGWVFGMARTIVTPPERAAAVPDEKSSLCVPPGSRRWTCTSIKPGIRTNRRDVIQSTCGFILGALPTNLKACWQNFQEFKKKSLIFQVSKKNTIKVFLAYSTAIASDSQTKVFKVQCQTEDIINDCTTYFLNYS